MDERDRPEAHLAGCTAAHGRLVTHLDQLVREGRLTDDVVRRPSRLPDWTVGHVLTHLARNADSFVRVMEGVIAGEQPTQYPGGREQRDGDIEAGAPRPAAQQVADVRHSIERLEEAWARTPAAAWTEGRWRNVYGDVAVADLAFRRWREVEIHHADLGLAGFGIEDWSARYVTEELAIATMMWTSRQPMGLTALPASALRLTPNHRLAWLMGRETPDGLEPVRFA